MQSVDKHYHLWSIEDAKNGDVLHSTGWHKDCIFIFNGLDNWKFDEPNEDRVVATGYCCLFVSADKIEFGIQGPDCIETNTVKPATKEQRDLLFEKMKESGYDWDAEKKELKKIHVIDEGKAKMDYCFTKMMNGEKVSTTWSEEDETGLTNTIIMLKEGASLHFNKKDITKAVDWLKSLRPQSQWRPSEEQLKSLKEVIDVGHFTSYPNALEILYEQLKKLREE
jgi:spermidine/putrescine-binding protein